MPLLPNEPFLVKIANSNVMPMLRGFSSYLYFGAQAGILLVSVFWGSGVVSGFEASK